MKTTGWTVRDSNPHPRVDLRFYRRTALKNKTCPKELKNLVTGGAAQIYSAFYHFLLPLATAFAGTYCIAVALPPLLAKLMILVMRLYTKACFEVDRTGVEPALAAYSRVLPLL